MNTIRTARQFLGIVMFLVLVLEVRDGAADENPPQEGFRLEESDVRAVEIADEVMRALGGREAWDATRYIRWHFFGRRMHYWDKWTGDVRIESKEKLVLMNIHSKKGRAWVDGEEVTAPDSLGKLMDIGYAWWVNDSYWMFMPFKLKDSGVALRNLGERNMQDGRAADVLELTFETVGLTPDNRYEVLVDKESRLVGEWTFYRDATENEPRFTMPWGNWQRVGRIMLAFEHGRGSDWKIAVYDELPRSVFDSPEPVQLD